MSLFSTLRLDILVEIVSLVTTLVITGFSFYAYHRTHQRRHLAFAFAFGLLAAASLSNLVFNWLVQEQVMQMPLRGFLAIPAYYDLFRFLFHLFSISGYITLFLIAERISSLKQITLAYMLAPLAAWAAHEFYFAYNVIAVVILAMALNHFYRVFLETGSNHSRNIAYGFGLLLASEVVLAFASFDLWFYHAGHVLRLLSFGLLLYTTACIYYMTKHTGGIPVRPSAQRGKAARR